MPVLDNDAINRANLHTAIQALAQGAGGVFVFVFLLRAGLPAPVVLCAAAAMTIGRFVLRTGVLPLARTIGLRNTLILGTVLEAAIFPLLPHVHGVDAMLGLVVAVSATGSVLYWTSYHAFFATMGDAEHRGGQTSAREVMQALGGVVAPALGGASLATLGPEVTFCVVAVVQALAAAPLLGARNIPVIAEAPGGMRAAWPAVRLQAADGWFGGIFVFVWQIALFIALGEGFATYGGAMALAALAGAVGGLVLGRLVDLGCGRGPVVVAYGVALVAVIARAAGAENAWAAAIANAFGALTVPLMTVVMMSRIYNMAKASPCPLRFHMATEAGWDLGCSGACLSAAALLWLHAPFGAALLLAAPAVVVMGALLAALYRRG